jgi:hypothetical protein
MRTAARVKRDRAPPGERRHVAGLAVMSIESGFGGVSFSRAVREKMAFVSTEEQILSYLSSRPATPEHLTGHLGISSEDPLAVSAAPNRQLDSGSRPLGTSRIVEQVWGTRRFVRRRSTLTDNRGASLRAAFLLGKIVPCCSPPPPLPSSRSSSASSSRSLLWPTSSVARDVEGPGHQVRPARPVARSGWQSIGGARRGE